MLKRCTLLLLLVIWTGFYLPVIAQQYGVQLSAFTHTIHTSFFHYKGYEQIEHQQDKNETVQYYGGHYETYAAAEIAYHKAKQQGFQNAQITKNSPIAFTVNKQQNNFTQTPSNQLFFRTLDWKNESTTINKEMRKLLSEVVQIMKVNPYLKIRFLNNEHANSMNHLQLKTISNFLTVNGIAPYRMRITNAHHDFLTAVNQLPGGPSTPKTQQHKVVLTLINLKEEIILDTFSPSLEKERLTSYEPCVEILENVMKSIRWS